MNETSYDTIVHLTRHVTNNFVNLTEGNTVDGQTVGHADADALMAEAQSTYRIYERCLLQCISEGHDVSSYQPNLAIIETWITDTLGGTVTPTVHEEPAENLAPTA